MVDGKAARVDASLNYFGGRRRTSSYECLFTSVTDNFERFLLTLEIIVSDWYLMSEGELWPPLELLGDVMPLAYFIYSTYRYSN